MSRRLTIVAHNGSSTLGGGETGTALLLAGLQERGHRVRMLCRDDSMCERIARYGIPTQVERIAGDLMFPDALRFAATLRRLRPDAVILTTYRKVFLAGLGARLGGVPFVVQRIVLSTDVPRGARYRLALRRFVDVIILNAEAMRSAFLAADPELDSSRVRTILDGVKRPGRRQDAGALRRELGIPEGARVVGSVGRLVKQKRFDRLLRALSQLPDDVGCVIAGEGEERAGLEHLADRLGVSRRVHLLGFREDVGDVLGTMDVFVLCSDREGMANAMLEGMAAGLPVVSTPVSGAREALGADEGSVAPGIVTDFTEDELARALRRLLDRPGERAEMARAARERWEQSFGWERFVDEWERLLEEGVGRGRRSS